MGSWDPAATQIGTQFPLWDFLLHSDFHIFFWCRGFIFAVCTLFPNVQSIRFQLWRSSSHHQRPLRRFLYKSDCYGFLTEYACWFSGKGKNTKFVRLLENARTEPMCSVGLLSLLVMPIQRIPRYRMLLEALLKETPQQVCWVCAFLFLANFFRILWRQHVDFSTLQESLVLVSKVAESINQV